MFSTDSVKLLPYNKDELEIKGFFKFLNNLNNNLI